MSNSVAMHSQISSIMEVLTKAAVAEICKLVDDGYAILRLEVSRSQQENEALKRKLSMHMAKPCDAGRCDRRSRVRAESAVARFDGPQLCNDGRNAVFAKEEMFIKQLDIRSGCEPAATDKRESRRQSNANVQKSTEKKEEERLESVYIKEEGSDEDPKHSALQSPLNSSMPRALEGEVVSPEEELRELPEEQRSGHRHSPWIDGGFGTSFKADPENEKESSTLRLEQPGAGTCPGPMTSLGYDYSIYERPGQLDTFFTQVSPDPEGEEAVCSFGTGADPESLAGDPELLPGPFTESRAANSPSSPAFHEEKPEVIVIDSEAAEDQLSSAWTEEMMSGASQALHKHLAGDGRSDRAQQSKYVKICVPQAPPLERASLSASLEPPGMSGYSACEETPAMAKSGPLYHRADARDRRFICTYCGKSFSCLKNLETHQRVHTGERPFSCAQCGKRFSQSAHLKKHQSVHTGEKPFGCAKCGKRFADSSNLKRHQNVHTGERPFRCAQCGKRFSLIGNLKRHQSVHMGKKPYRGAVWEGLVL